MQHPQSKPHYKKCVYPNCGITNRNSKDTTTFHHFPVKDNDRCITWLVNCGLDDWAEMTNTELQKKYVCSRHFVKSSFYASGLLRKTAIPKIYLREDSSDENCNTVTSPLRKECVESVLENRLMEIEEQLKQEKNKCNILRLQVRAKSKAINRLKNKVSTGLIDDTCLKKAIARKVSGFVFTFIMMLLFKPCKKIFTRSEQELCMTMHYTSPTLYNKMRSVFGFNLPSPATIVRWFGKIAVLTVEKQKL